MSNTGLYMRTPSHSMSTYPQRHVRVCSVSDRLCLRCIIHVKTIRYTPSLTNLTIIYKCKSEMRKTRFTPEGELVRCSYVEICLNMNIGKLHWNMFSRNFLKWLPNIVTLTKMHKWPEVHCFISAIFVDLFNTKRSKLIRQWWWMFFFCINKSPWKSKI